MSLTIELPEEVMIPLQREAAATGLSIEVVVQQALANAMRSKPHSHLRSLAGSWSSNIPDAGVQHDKYLGEALYDKLQEPKHD